MRHELKDFAYFLPLKLLVAVAKVVIFRVTIALLVIFIITQLLNTTLLRQTSTAEESSQTSILHYEQKDLLCTFKYNYSEGCSLVFISPTCCGDGSMGELFLNGETVHTWRPVSFGHVFIINRSCQLQTIKAVADITDMKSFLKTIPRRTAVATIMYDIMGRVAHIYRHLGLLERQKWKMRAYVRSPRPGYLAMVGWWGYGGHLQWDILTRKHPNVTFRKVYHFGEGFDYNTTQTTEKDVIQHYHNGNVKSGDVWKPEDCKSRERIAIIVPYRNREDHLWMFLNNIIPFLQLQNVEFAIIIVEQTFPEFFNRASLMNIGYQESRKLGNFDCFAFHDVDMIPEDLSNLYSCNKNPRLLATSRSADHYRIKDKDYVYFGGAIMLSKGHIEAINGFPNKIYGWGGEDDIIYSRLHEAGYTIERYPAEIGTYFCFPHDQDEGNPHRKRDLYATRHYAVQSMSTDGLNNIDYELLAMDRLPLYTHILVHIPGPRNETELQHYELSQKIVMDKVRDPR